jgi:hypothetical protein
MSLDGPVIANGRPLWLSASSEDIGRARAFLRSMSLAGVVDELGFGVIASAFSERFYPAVTTVMKGAAYLVYIPALYRHLETAPRPARKSVEDLSRSLQESLCRAFIARDQKPIGVDKVEDLVRMPSSIYWRALVQLGIARMDIGEAAYQERIANGEFRGAAVRDDDHVERPENRSLWLPSRCYPRVFEGQEVLSAATMDLSAAQAEFLSGRYAELRPLGRPSLMHGLLTIGKTKRIGAKAVDAIEYPWDVGDATVLDSELLRLLEHARLFSLFARGATLHYHVLLLRLRREDDQPARAALQAWWESAAPELERWVHGTGDAQLVELRGLLAILGAGARAEVDVRFVSDWLAVVLAAGSIDSLLRDRGAAQVVERREARTRPGRQRLRSEHYLATWRPERALYKAQLRYQLSYRHEPAKQIAADIARGLAAGA